MALSKTLEEYRPPRKGEYLTLPEHLISKGEDAVPLLCEYLEDPRLRMRILAARMLKEAGDARAVEPLRRMLEQYAGPVTPWMSGVGRLLLLGALGTVTALVSLALIMMFGSAVSPYPIRIAIYMAFMSVELVAVVCFLSDVFDARPIGRASALWRDTVAKFGGHDLFVRAAVDALAAIAERCPGAALQQALPVLRKVAGDPVRHNQDTRQAATRAAARVQMSSAGCRRLPIACAPAVYEAGNLPIAHEPGEVR